MQDSQTHASMHPTYGARFKCIGAACEDTCCHGFAVPVDRRTYERYQNFQQPRLASLAQNFITLNPAPGAPDSLYANLDLLPSGDCAFFTADRLCGIQIEDGPEALCATCSIYPRVLNTVGGTLEVSLNLSCPEAARSVLLNDGLLHSEAEVDWLSGDLNPGLPHAFRTDQSSLLATAATCPIHKPWEHFDSIRELIFLILRERKHSLPRRLFLLGSLARALSGITSVARDETVPAILAVYRSMLAQPLSAGVRSSKPSATQLEIVLQLSALRLQEGAAGERFRNCFEEFQQGIGYCLESTAIRDLRSFREADASYCQPFFTSHPLILENYLVNYVVKTLFPFGRGASVHSTPMTISDEFLLMAMQFTWVYGLLTGIAGLYEKRFGEDQAIRTIQAYSKAVEHHPGFLLKIVAFAKARHLDTPEGIADLLQC